MKHKHRWQFVRIYDCEYQLNDDGSIDKKSIKKVSERGEFICECGEIRLMEVKR